MAESANTIFELFTCINCNSVKQCSYILACFHVICGDCSESVNSNLRECCVLPRNPQELVQHPLTKQYAQQLQSLLEVHTGGKEKNVCVICQDMEGGNTDVMFCVQCASFWCQTHLLIHHRAMLKGNEHPFFRFDTDIELKELLTGAKGGSVAVSEKEDHLVTQFIQKCEEIIREGEEHQKKLEELNITVDKWREMVGRDLGNRFTTIREKLAELEEIANTSIDKKCQDTRERLDQCFGENEKKLRNLHRGIEMIQQVNNLCPNKASEILSILTIDKIKKQSMTSFVTFLLEMIPNITKINRELEADSNQNVIEARIIEPNYTYVEFRPDRQLYEGMELTIIVQTCDKLDTPTFSTNSVIEMEINRIKSGISTNCAKVTLKALSYEKKSQGYSHRVSMLEASNYQLKLFVNNCKVQRKWKFTVTRDLQTIKEPTRCKLTGKGEAKAIAFHKNKLYVSTPSQQEVGVYSIDEGFYTKETVEETPLSPLPPRFSASDDSKCFTPRFDRQRFHNLSPESTETSFPNPKFGVKYEDAIGKGMLAGPHGICCYEDYIYVSDKVLHTVFCFTNIGAFIQKFGIRGDKVGEFSSPHGIAINKTLKLLVVSDRYNDRIQLVDLQTGSMMVVENSEGYMLKQPLDVAITMEDYYIVSTFKNDILFFDNTFQWISVIIEEIDNPFHITIDQTNQLYVSSYTGHRIYMILPLPQPLHGFNVQQIEISSGEFPNGVTIGEDGTLYTVCHNTKETPFEQLLFGW